MDLALDIEIESKLRTDFGRGQLPCYRPLLLSDSGVEGDVVVSGSDRVFAVNHLIRVTFEGKSCDRILRLEYVN